MQYTGLKDKYGKEIYEGDIIGYYCQYNKKDILFEVRYGIADTTVETEKIILVGFYLYCLFGNYDRNDFFDEYKLQACKYYGNIYENPELFFRRKEIK